MKKFKLIIVLLLVLFAFVFAKEEKTISKVFDAKETIKIYTVSGDCTIKKSKDLKVHLLIRHTYSPEKYVPEFFEEGNSIKMKEKFKSKGSFRGKSMWEIQVPEKVNIVFNSASGDLKLRDLKVKLDSNTASGDFKLNDVIGDINVSTASGDLKLVNLTGNLSFRSASGDLKISNITGDINYKTASGDFDGVNLIGSIRSKSASGDLDLKKVEGSVNTKTASGDTRIKKIQIKGDSSFKSASGDVRLGLAGPLKGDISISTASGDASMDYIGNKMEGYFTLITKKSNGDDITVPFSFDNTEVYKKWGKKMVKKTTKVKKNSPKIEITSYSGDIKISK